MATTAQYLSSITLQLRSTTAAAAVGLPFGLKVLLYRRLLTAVCALLGIVLLAPVVCAQGQEVVSEAASNETQAAELADSDEPLEVTLIAIGESLPLGALAGALGSDIPDGLYLMVARGQSFDKERFLGIKRAQGRKIEIWVDASDREHVRLYFADAAHSRYALRHLTLSGAMDEMDLEVLAQAIAWSLRALTEGSVGTLSRTEVQSQLSPEVEPQAAQPAEERQTPPSKVEPQETKPWRSSQRSYLTDARLFYRASVYSPAIALVHGPGLAVGLFRGGKAWLWGLEMNAQWQLPREHEESDIVLKLSAINTRLAFQVLHPMNSRFAVGAQLGGGFDVIGAKASSNDSGSIAARERSTSLAWLLGPGLYSQVKLAQSLALSVHADLEVTLTSPRFEVATQAGEQSFMELYALRPSLSVGLGFP